MRLFAIVYGIKVKLGDNNFLAEAGSATSNCIKE